MSAVTRAPSTITVVDLTGQTDFNVPFDYLARKFVIVTLLGAERKVLALNTDYRFVTKTTISLVNPTPAGYDKLEIRRVTDVALVVDFQDGSILRASAMNMSQLQSIHIAEESRDSVSTDGMGIADDGNLDARGRRIKNVAFAVEARDAVPLGQVLAENNNAFASAQRAEAEANRAQGIANSLGVVKDLGIAVGSTETSGIYLKDGADVVTEGKRLGDSVESAMGFGGNIMTSVRDLEISVNKLGVTLEAEELIRVEFDTAVHTDEGKRLRFVMQSVPAGYVFSRITTFGSLYCLMYARKTVPREHIGGALIGYSLVEYNGNQYHMANLRGDLASKFRMSYYDGTMRTVGETLEHLGFRFCRVATNASPLGSGPFPSTINNGKLVPGDPNNTYFISSCFFTADGKLHVVPHKDRLVSDVVKDYYYNHNAIQSMHFRYVLVKDGEVYDLVANGYTTEIGWTGQPSGRTSIGQRADGSMVLAVIDGNTSAGTGVTVKEMAEFMKSRGCINAMNLDGSGSSTMYIGGELKNSPSDGRERKIPNIIYFQ